MTSVSFRWAARHDCLVLALPVTAAAAASVAAGEPWPVPIAMLVVFAGACAFLVPAAHRSRHRFAAADRVTLTRAAIMSVLAGFACGAPIGERLRWALGLVAVLALALDGVDGWIARRQGRTDAFGASFDMETDALTVLVLALLVWTMRQADAWVLIIGAMRYLYAGAGWVVPALKQPLPPSGRRRAVCVVTVATLVICVTPLVSPEFARGLCGGAAALLCYSFARDGLYLLRNAGSGGIQPARGMKPRLVL